MRTISDDPLHEACTEISRIAVNVLRELADDLHAEDLDHFTRDQCLLMAGHEFIWELAEQLVRSGLMVDPSAVLDAVIDDGNLKSMMYVRPQV